MGGTVATMNGVTEESIDWNPWQRAATAGRTVKTGRNSLRASPSDFKNLSVAPSKRSFSPHLSGEGHRARPHDDRGRTDVSESFHRPGAPVSRRIPVTGARKEHA